MALTAATQPVIAAGSNSTTWPVNFSTLAPANGDMIVVLVESDAVVNSISGFTSISSGSGSAANVGLGVFWRRWLTGDPTTVTLTVSASVGTPQAIALKDTTYAGPPTVVTSLSGATTVQSVTLGPIAGLADGRAVAVYASQSSNSSGWTRTYTNGFVAVSTSPLTTNGTLDVATALTTSTANVSTTLAVGAAGTDSGVGALMVFPPASGGTTVTLGVGVDRLSSTGQAVSATAVAANGSGTKTYAWTQSGAAGTFSSTTSATPTWTGTTAGVATLTCTVTDTSGSASDSLLVTVRDATKVISPVAAPTTTGTVTLTGTEPGIETDADNTTYRDMATGATVALVYGAVPQPAAGSSITYDIAGRYAGSSTAASCSVAFQSSPDGTTWTTRATKTLTFTGTEVIQTATFLTDTDLSAVPIGSWGTASRIRIVETWTVTG